MFDLLVSVVVPVKFVTPLRTRGLNIVEEWMCNKLLCTPALLRILFQCPPNKVFHGVWPLIWEWRNRFVYNGIEEFIKALAVVGVEGWVCGKQLVREASECPYVNLCRVIDALSDLRWYPRRCSLLAGPVLFLLWKETTETHVGQLDFSIGAHKDIIRLDVPVKD